MNAYMIVEPTNLNPRRASALESASDSAVRAGMSLREITSAGQQIEAKTLVKAIKLYLTKRLDVYWGTVKEV